MGKAAGDGGLHLAGCFGLVKVTAKRWQGVAQTDFEHSQAIRSQNLWFYPGLPAPAKI